jgi:hypothetical protein
MKRKIFIGLGMALFSLSANTFAYEEYWKIKEDLAPKVNVSKHEIQNFLGQDQIEIKGTMTLRKVLNLIADTYGYSANIKSDAVDFLDKEYKFNLKGDFDSVLNALQRLSDLWIYYNPINNAIEVKRYRWFTIETDLEGITKFSLAAGGSTQIGEGGGGSGGSGSSGGGGGGSEGASGGSSGGGGGGTTGFMYSIQNEDYKTLLGVLSGLNVKIVPFMEGILKVKATPSQYETIRNIFTTLRKYREIVIGKVSIIRVDLNKNLKTGIDWDAIFSGFKVGSIKHLAINVNLSQFAQDETPVQLSLINSKGDTKALLQLLDKYGNAKVVNTWIFEGKTGTIIPFGSYKEEPYITFQVVEGQSSTQVVPVVAYKYAGFFGNIFITKQSDKYFTEIALNLSDIYGYFDFKTKYFEEQIPKLQTNQLKVATYLPDIDNITLLLTGFKIKTTSNNQIKVPFLGDIPLIGNIFKSTVKTKTDAEFIVLISLKKYNKEFFIEKGTEYINTLKRAKRVEKEVQFQKKEKPERDYIPVF